MRTTLDIEDDVLLAAKELARRDKTTLGQTISALARRAFQAGAAAPTEAPATALQVSERLASYGIQPLPARGGVVSNALIDRLRDAEGI
ncbi:MAG: CopG family transcriptional regulator [Rhodoferax sp.]|nr:CopG family transcriptional regulator [Rhodoferax sp.]